MKRPGLFFASSLLLACLCSRARPSQDLDKRKADLEWMLKTFPKSESWEKWLQQTGDLPPDFDAMPSIPGLPDPLLMQTTGGEVRITTSEQWPPRREQLVELFKHYVIGTFPPPPGNVRGNILSDRQEAGATVQEIQLEFGPDHGARLWMELILPKGKGPFPVFLTQENHCGWALVAVSRGYVGCIYAGADSRDDTGTFVSVWPECDWTKLTRRA